MRLGSFRPEFCNHSKLDPSTAKMSAASGNAARYEAASFLEQLFAPDLAGGTLLIVATAVALVWANSGASDWYDAVWGARFTIGFEGFQLSKPLVLWVNDLLMAIFFLLVGLEIKAELLTGELNSPRKAAVPAIAALGGMLLPAAIFFLVAHGDPCERGWGTPIATDIAFALGCLRMLGKRVPASLLVFLTALAIIDDLGAILVITIFYAHDISTTALATAAVLTIVLVVANRVGVRRISTYMVLGAALWVATLKSGIHATIAGVIVGLCIPAAVSAGDSSEPAASESPLRVVEHALAPWVNLVIIPLFALANAGIRFGEITLRDLNSPAVLGIVLGLVVGKQLGIFSVTYAAVRLGLGSLPVGVTWRHVYGVRVLAGIGFTMALFIAALAYGEGNSLAEQAKIAILIASLVCGAAGILILLRASLPHQGNSGTDSG
jgi:Na+:H+ antiporter, NhaA family